MKCNHRKLMKSHGNLWLRQFQARSIGHLSFLIILQMSHGEVRSFVQISTVGLLKGANARPKFPIPGTSHKFILIINNRSNIYLQMIEFLPIFGAFAECGQATFKGSGSFEKCGILTTFINSVLYFYIGGIKKFKIN